MSSSIFSDPNREKRIGNIMGSEIKDGQELGIITQAQNEIAGIAGEQRNNLAMQQQMAQNRMGQNQILQQAAGMMAMDAGVEAQVQGMNDSTQQLMQKYGIKPGADYKRLSQSYTSTASGSTTNYKTENVSNTKNEIHITQPQIVQGSQQNQGGQATQAKLKTWLDGVFAKQNTEAEIQEKEFRKREWSLNKAASKMMGRIESASKTFAEKMDPRKISKAMGSEFSFVLMSFAGMMLAKYWTPLLKKIDSFESGVREFFGLPAANNGKGGTKKGKSFMTRIKEFLGAKDGESETLVGVLKGLVSDIAEKLKDGLQILFEDRGKAIQKVVNDFKKKNANEKSDSWLNSDLLGLKTALSDGMAFLGEVGRAALIGTSALSDISATKNRMAAKKRDIRKTENLDYKLTEDNYDFSGHLKLDDNNTVLRSSANIRHQLLGDDSDRDFDPGSIASTFSSYEHYINENGQVKMLLDTAIRLLPGGYEKAKKFLYDLIKSGDASGSFLWVKPRGANKESLKKAYNKCVNIVAGISKAAGRLGGGKTADDLFGVLRLYDAYIDGTAKGAKVNIKGLELVSEAEANKTKAAIACPVIIFKRSGWSKFKKKMGLTNKEGEEILANGGNSEYLKAIYNISTSRAGYWQGKTASGIKENINSSIAKDYHTRVLDSEQNQRFQDQTNQKWKDWRRNEGAFKGKYEYLEKAQSNIEDAYADLSESAGNAMMKVAGSEEQRAFISKFRPLIESELKRRGIKADDEIVNAILGHWAYESAWGTSPLAVKGNNFGGITYSTWMTKKAHKGDKGFATFDSVEDFVKNEFDYYARRQYLNEENLNKGAFLKLLENTGYCEDGRKNGYAKGVNATINSVSSLRGIMQTVYERGEGMVNTGKDIKQGNADRGKPLTQEEIYKKFAWAAETGDFDIVKGLKPTKIDGSKYPIDPTDFARYLSERYDGFKSREDKERFLKHIRNGEYSLALRNNNPWFPTSDFSLSDEILRERLLSNPDNPVADPLLEAYCRTHYGASASAVRGHLEDIQEKYKDSLSFWEKYGSYNYRGKQRKDFINSGTGWYGRELEKRLHPDLSRIIKSSNEASKKAKEEATKTNADATKASVDATIEVQNSTERQTAYMGDGLQAINANLAKINNTLSIYLPKNTSPGNANVAPAPEANPVAIA